MFIHELGHQAGFGHTEGADAMSPGLPLGVRRLPSMEAANSESENGIEALVAAPDGTAIEAHLSLDDVRSLLASQGIQAPAALVDSWSVARNSHLPEHGGTHDDSASPPVSSVHRTASVAWPVLSVRSTDLAEPRNRMTTMVDTTLDGRRIPLQTLESALSTTVGSSAHPRGLDDSTGVYDTLSADNRGLRSGSHQQRRELLGRRNARTLSHYADEYAVSAIAAAQCPARPTLARKSTRRSTNSAMRILTVAIRNSPESLHGKAEFPGGALCIVPVHAQHRGRLFLPFADDDPRTAEVVAKVLLLAHDREIQDPTILEQIVH